MNKTQYILQAHVSQVLVYNAFVYQHHGIIESGINFGGFLHSISKKLICKKDRRTYRKNDAKGRSKNALNVL